MSLSTSWYNDYSHQLMDKSLQIDESSAIIHDYSFINNYTTPAYHRLDCNIQITKDQQKGRKSVWTFGVYNMYNRTNPFVVEVYTSRLQMTSIFQIMPFINYQFKL